MISFAMSGMRRSFLAWLALLLLGPTGRPAAQGPVVEDRFDITTCDVLGANGESCGRVRFGWADCPGQRGVPCDVCYSPSGEPFAYVPRTNRSYSLSSACDNLDKIPAADVYLIASNPDEAGRWEAKGLECDERGRELICQKPPGAGKRGGPEKKPPTPAQTAADKIRRQWREGKGGPSFSYAAVPFGPRGGTLHAVEVRGRFEVGYDPKKKTVAQFVDDSGAAGGVTGTFFGPFGPAGPVFVDGKNVQRKVEPTSKTVKDRKTGKAEQVPVPRSFLGSGGRGFFVHDLPADLGTYQQEIDKLKKDPGLHGLGGTGRLLRGGRDVHLEEAKGKQGLTGQADDTPDARVVAGIAGPSRLLLLVQEGDDLKGMGAGIRQLGEVLRELGATEAVILDGGGSTQIKIPSLGVEYRGDGRSQPTAILFR